MLAEIAFRLSGTSWRSYPIRGHLVTSAGVLVQPATPMSRSTRMFDIFADRGVAQQLSLSYMALAIPTKDRVCQGDGIGAFDADSDSLSRVVNLDFDKIIVEGDGEFFSYDQTGELQFFQHFRPLRPLMLLPQRSSLGQQAAWGAFEFSSPHGNSEPPYSEAIGYTIYSEGFDWAHSGVIPC